MKKILLSTLAVAALAFNSNAQVRFGPEIGLNMAEIASTGIAASFKAGVRAGGFVDVPLGDHFALQPGLFYTMMGGKVSINLSGAGGSGDFTTHYIYLPVDVLYKFGEPDGNRFFLGLGPEVGYCLSGTATSGGTSNKLKIGTDASSDFKPLDFGLNGLVGYELSMGLTFKAGYYVGLMNISPSPSAGNPSVTSINYAFQLSVGWLFGGSSY